jgi:hypothetical protein
MSDGTSGLNEDLRFLRSLAEAGKNRPLWGGIFLVVIGGIWTVATFVDWLGWTGVIALDGRAADYISVAAVVLTLATGFALTPARTGVVAQGPSTFAFRIAWAGISLGIFATLAVEYVASRRLGPVALASQDSMILCFYGVGWFISSALVKRWWFLGVAIGSFALAVALALLPYGPTKLLAYSISIALLTVVPGVVLMTQERR